MASLDTIFSRTFRSFSLRCNISSRLFRDRLITWCEGLERDVRVFRDETVLAAGNTVNPPAYQSSRHQQLVGQAKARSSPLVSQAVRVTKRRTAPTRSSRTRTPKDAFRQSWSRSIWLRSRGSGRLPRKWKRGTGTRASQLFGLTTLAPRASCEKVTRSSVRRTKGSNQRSYSYSRFISIT